MGDCPIYRGAYAAADSTPRENRHHGLWFDKFATSPLPSGSGNSEKQEWKTKWLSKIAGNVGDSDRLQEAATRQAELIHRCGGRLLCFENTSPFATGLGRPHPVENGFAWHHSLSVPYLAGSGLKGVTSSWWCEENSPKKDDSRIASLFGTPDGAGDFIFLDLVPTQPVKLVVDIMTPHYGDYYQDKKTPGDWINPVPIPFLTVAAGGRWQTGVLPRDRGWNSDEELIALANTITDAVLWGVGAKTAVGYGSLERHQSSENRAWERHVEKVEDELKASKLAKLPEDLRELQERFEKDEWAKHQDFFIPGCNRYLDDYPNASAKCIEWICEVGLVRLGSKYKDAWKDPETPAKSRSTRRKRPTEYPAPLIPILKRLKTLRED